MVIVIKYYDKITRYHTTENDTIKIYWACILVGSSVDMEVSLSES